MVPSPPHSLCYISGTLVERTVTGGRGAQRRPLGCNSDGTARAWVGVLDDVDRTVRGGRFSRGRRRQVRLTTARRWRRRQGGSHGPAAPTASSEPGPPL